MHMLEAFRALNALNEDVFSLDADGVGKLSDFTQTDDLEDDVQIIDPEAETKDDLQDNYIGKVILDCCVCHSKLYKDPSEVNVDEDGELANVGEECPYCFTPDGFKVIGEVVAFEGNKEEAEEAEDDSAPESEDSQEQPEDEEPVEENLKEGLIGDINVPITANVDASGSSVGFLGGTAGDIANEDLEEDCIEEGIFGIKTKKEKEAARKRQAEIDAYKKRNEEDARLAQEWRDWCAQSQKNGEERERRERAERDARAASRRSSSSRSSSGSPSNTARAGINYSGGDYYSESLDEGIFGKKKKPAQKPTASVKAKKWQVYDLWNKYVVGEFDTKPEAEESAASRGHDGRYRVQLSESLSESIEDLSLTANDTHVEVSEEDNGKVTVTMEPVTVDNGEAIAPVSTETEAEIMADEVIEEPAEEIPEEEPSEEEPSGEEIPAEEQIDADFDEFDEGLMNGLGESYFKKVYENVNSFKTTAVKTSGNSMIIEGLLEFDSGNKKNTSFIFEALDATKNGKFRFVGDNKEITEGKKAFMLTGTINNNKLMVESMNYNYKHIDAEGKTSRVYGTERINKGE